MKDLAVQLDGIGAVPLSTLTTSSFSINIGELQDQQKLQVYDAFIAKNCKSVDVGNYVSYSEDGTEVRTPRTLTLTVLVFHSLPFMLQKLYGEVVACVQTSAGNKYCFVRPLELLSVSNEYNCPLLLRAYTIKLIRVMCVASAVSIMHECTSTCTFSDQLQPQTIERESVVHNSLTFEHDFTNDMFSLNVYCLNTP